MVKKLSWDLAVLAALKTVEIVQAEVGGATEKVEIKVFVATEAAAGEYLVRTDAFLYQDSHPLILLTKTLSYKTISSWMMLIWKAC